MKDKCLACHQKNCLIYFRKAEQILSCNQCDAIFMENEEESKSKEIFYHEDHKEPTLLEKIIINIRGYNLTRNSEAYVKYLKSKTDMKFKNALDIGTNYGKLVKYFNKIGIDAYGIESDQRLVKLAESKKIKWAYFDKDYQTDTKYDLICLTQMLYYQRDSYGILENVKKMLSSDGLVFIATMNPQSSIIKNELTKIPTYGANMVLSKKNFESLEDKIGLKMLDYSTYRSNLSYDYHSGKNKILVFLKYYLKLKDAIIQNPDGNYAFVLLKSVK